MDMQKRVLAFQNDETGGGTVFGLFAFALFVGICGLAVDATDGFRIKTGLQATADSAALAASMDLPNEVTARVSALIYADTNMPSDVHGDVLRLEDIEFGVWDAETRTLDVGALPADAVRVKLHRSVENGNEVSLNFLRILGLSAWNNIAAEAVAQRFVPPCLNDGLFARQIVNISSNNDFVENICVHGEEGVDMQNNNFFELGTNVSMPYPETMLSIPAGGMTSNPGLSDALMANSYNFAMVDDLANIIYTLWHPELDTGEVAVVPDYVVGDAKTYDIDYTVDGLNSSDLNEMTVVSESGGTSTLNSASSLDASLSAPLDGSETSTLDAVASTDLQFTDIPIDRGAKEILKINCNWNETYNIPSSIVLTDIVIVADCRIHVGSSAVLNNVVLASTAVGNGSKPLDYQNITFAANVQLGDMDDCAPGGGVQIYSMASVHFSSSMKINGLQVVAAGNVELGARDQAIKGISVQAGQNITLTSNNVFGLCSGGSPTALTKPSFRLVL